MRLRAAGSYTMEALALISALCIAGIFVYNHYSRQMDALDQRAYRLAREVGPTVTKFFAAHPQAELTDQELGKVGLPSLGPIKMKVPFDHEKASDWQVRLWHPEGNQVFIVSSAGISQKPR